MMDVAGIRPLALVKQTMMQSPGKLRLTMLRQGLLLAKFLSQGLSIQHRGNTFQTVQPLCTYAGFSAILTHSHCRWPAEESEADKGNADLLLPFLQTAGALVLNLLGAQLHHKDAAQFTTSESAQGQGESPLLHSILTYALVIVVLCCDSNPRVQV